MYKELKKFKSTNYFNYTTDDQLDQVCNAPELGAGIFLVVVAGKEYGTGSSRDWAAKGTFLQGIKAVVTESFERIHRSNSISAVETTKLECGRGECV